MITFAKIAKQCEVIMQEASKAWDFLCSLRRRPVYTLRIAGPICRHDGKGTLIVRLIWRPICGRKSTDSVNFLHIFFLAFIYKMVFFANNFVVYCNKTKLLCNNYISSDYKKKKKKKKIGPIFISQISCKLRVKIPVRFVAQYCGANKFNRKV